MQRVFSLLFFLFCLWFSPQLFSAEPLQGEIKGNPCGLSPSDWCASAPNDPCGKHKNAASCKADPNCEGMRYRGESVVSCQWDERNFATNCPTVGCRSKKFPQ